MIEFISYSGKYPHLCCGCLRLMINNEEVIFDNILASGGYCGIDGDYEEYVEQDEWYVNDGNLGEYEKYRSEILDIINENVEFGCCGGCL